jgi:hypothetical protein
MRRLVMWLVAVGVSVGLAGCSCPMAGGGGEKKAPAKATTAAKAAVTTAAKAVTK